MLNLIDGNAGNLPRLIIVSLVLSSGLLIILIILEVVAFKFVYELILVTPFTSGLLCKEYPGIFGCVVLIKIKVHSIVFIYL